MEGDARRQELLRLISKSQKPISGTELAQTCLLYTSDAADE